MRVVHIIPNLRRGGAEHLSIDICSKLTKLSGMQVILVALNDLIEYSELLQNVPYKIIPSKFIPSITGRVTDCTEELFSFLRQFKPHIIHSHLFEAEMVSRSKLLPEVKYFSHCHNNMEQFESLNLKTFLSKKRITNFYEKMLLTRQYIKCNNHFIAISSHTQNFFKRNLPETLRNNIHLLHNAIEFDQFCLQSRKQPGLNLVNIGTFNENKNQRFLIDVLVELHNRGYSQATITFCGSGSSFSDVVSYAEKKGVFHAANFLGTVANLKAVLSEKNIYVHAAKSEALGLTLLEAMAAGLPVVTLDGGGNRDLIEQGKNGWMIYKEDVQQFADAILKIANNENLYHQMSSYAVEFARQFDMNIYIQKLVQLYKDA